MKDIEISRDKKNPTWALVWDCDGKTKLKRILLSICEHGCVCIDCGFEEKYMNNEIFETCTWTFYEIIKEPIYRPIQTLEDYIEATKDRKDFRAINIQEKRIYDLSSFKEEPFGNSFFYVNGNCLPSRNAFNAYVWLDDRSPVGVKCL